MERGRPLPGQNASRFVCAALRVNTNKCAMRQNRSKPRTPKTGPIPQRGKATAPSAPWRSLTYSGNWQRRTRQRHPPAQTPFPAACKTDRCARLLASRAAASAGCAVATGARWWQPPATGSRPLDQTRTRVAPLQRRANRCLADKQKPGFGLRNPRYSQVAAAAVGARLGRRLLRLKPAAASCSKASLI